MKHYVLGFVFPEELDMVALIQKQRPEWQRGHWNGIGGHIEPSDESNAAAMAREFREETTGQIPIHSWTFFASLKGSQDWAVECYYARLNREKFFKLEARQDEQIGLWPICRLPYKVLPNLRWLIPMALSWQHPEGDVRRETCQSFNISEIQA